MRERLDMVVYTMGWAIDQEAASVEECQVQLRCRVTLNGKEIDVLGIEIKTEHGDFLEAKLKLAPSTLRVVPLLGDAFSAETLPS